jgi:hypothetical protein
MSRQTVLLLALVLMIASCSNQKTAGGLEFTTIKKGDGKIVQPGEYLELELVVRDEQDSVWLDTRSKNVTTLVKVEKENEKFPSQVFTECFQRETVFPSIWT